MKRFYSIIVCFLLLSAGVQAQCTLSPGTQATSTVTSVFNDGSMNAPTGLTGQSTGAGIVTEYILTDPTNIVVDTGYDPTDPGDTDTGGPAIVGFNSTGQFSPLGVFPVGSNYDVTAYTYELGAIQTAIDNITGSAACCSGITAIVETAILNGPLPGGLDICQLLASGGINSGADVTSLGQVTALVGAFGGISTIPAIDNFLAAASSLSGSACVGVTACGVTSNTLSYPVIANCTDLALNLSVNCDANGAASGTLAVSATGGDGNYTFSGAANGMVVANGNTVTVTVTDGNNCTATQSLTATCPGFTLCPDGSTAQAPGTACDDGDANTNNDVIGADGCTCAGTATVACNVMITETNYNCDEDAGEFTYTWSFTGGAPSSDPLEVYTVNGTNILNQQLFAGTPLTVTYADGTAVSITVTDSQGCTDTWSTPGPVACTKSCPGDIVADVVYECNDITGVFSYTVTLSGGEPATDPTLPYTITGTNIGAPLQVFAGQATVFTFSDGTAVDFLFEDDSNCSETFSSNGPVACLKDDDCPGDITISPVFECDNTTGVFTYTFTINGGVPGTNPTEAYTVTGSGIGAGLNVFANSPFPLSFSDGSPVVINVVDSGGCTQTFDSGGPVACVKDGDCPGDITISEVFDCNNTTGVFTYTFTINGGVPGTDPTAAYSVTGTGIGAPLSVFAGSPFTLSYADGTAVLINVTDSGGCTGVFDTVNPVACVKDDDCPGDIFASAEFACDEDAGVFTYTITVGGGLPATDPTEAYTVTGTGIGAPLNVFAGAPFSLSFSDGSSVLLNFSDSAGCTGTFDSGGPVPCTKGCECAIAPAQLTWSDGSTLLNVCEGAASATGTVTVTVPPNAPNGAFIVTDASGTQILDGPAAGPTFDFSGAPAGTCQLWHVAWDCEFALPASNLVADIDAECWMLSNPLTVVRAPIQGGHIVDGPTNSESIVVCTDSEVLGHKVTIEVTTPPTGSQFAYVVTDETGTTIVAGPAPGPIFDFFGAGVGTCLIWQVTWNGNINIPDNQVANITADCLALSNPITVYRIDCEDDVPDDCLAIAFPPGPFTACSNAPAINASATVTLQSTQTSVINYSLTTGPSGTGTVVATNNTGQFAFPGGAFNTNYYVSAVTGNDLNGDGIADAGICNQFWTGPTLSWQDCTIDPPLCASVAMTQGVQVACPGDVVSATASVTGGTVGQAIVYAIHDGMNGAVGNILATNTTGVFSAADLNAPSFSSQYNLSVLVGPDNNGDGIPDNNDPCFQVVYGPFVTFLGEVFVNTEIICDEDTGETTLLYWVQGGLPSADQFAAYTINGDQVAGVYTAAQMPIQVVYASSTDQVSLSAYDPFCDSEEVALYNLEDCTKPAPIELLDFDATGRDYDNYITWSTATEINNDFFVLERSLDGANFEPIQTIDGAGSTTYTINYDFVDTDVEESGTYYYRLTQVDYNGLSTTSDVVFVKRGATESTFGVSPIPATSFINVFLDDLNLDEKVTVAIYDISGREIDSMSGVGLNSLLQVDISHLAVGVYFVTANDGSFVHTTKFIKE